MPAITRLGDLSSGHGCFPARPSTSASSDVKVNGIGVVRVGDSYATHCCGPSCHGGSLSGGSPNVTANGLAVGRIGDPISCGDTVAQGSPNVSVN